MIRRLLAAAICGAFCIAALPARVPGQGETVPMSIGSLYFAKKNFRVGDWVLYRLDETTARFGSSTRFQRIQIGGEEIYRGENCFWLETGYGRDADSLVWSAVLMSESVFEDSLADVHSNFYLRKIHVGKDVEGYPIATPTRTLNAKKLPDMTPYRPRFEERGNETLRFGELDLPCRIVEAKRNFGRLKDLPDSTQRRMIEETATRWYSPELVPVTGLARERSRKITRVQTWPNGKPSTDFAQVIEEDMAFELTLLEFGHDAKPKLADRMRSSVGNARDTEAPAFSTD
jgi:hypothetical protein